MKCGYTSATKLVASRRNIGMKDGAICNYCNTFVPYDLQEKHLKEQHQLVEE